MQCTPDNPFDPDRVLRERYRLDSSGWALLGARLRALRHRGAIVGPKGSGKTTLLNALAGSLEAEGWRIVRLSMATPLHTPDQPRLWFSPWGPRSVLLLDDADHLSILQWLLVRFRARGVGGLVITSLAPGRLLTLWRCRTTPALLRDLSGSLGVPLAEHDATDLFARHAGNLRSALRELHDRHARHVG